MSPEFAPVTFPAITGTMSHFDDDSRLAEEAAGYAAGYAAGLRSAGAELLGEKAALDAEHRAGMRHESARMDRAIAVLSAAAGAMESRLLPVVSDAQETVAASALALAEAIIGIELADGSRSARAAVTRALATVDPSTVTAVRLNPLDLGVLTAEERSAAAVQFSADESVARGDAIVDLPIGFLDARIGTAVSRARASLLGENS